MTSGDCASLQSIIQVVIIMSNYVDYQELCRLQYTYNYYVQIHMFTIPVQPCPLNIQRPTLKRKVNRG